MREGGGEYNSISLRFGRLWQYFFYFKAYMFELQKIFLLVRFFNCIFCNKGLKAKIVIQDQTFFYLFLLFILPWGWNVLESERPFCSWCHIGWRNTKICIYGASQMKQKHVKMLKTANFWRKIASFYQLSEWNENSQYILLLFFVLALFIACFYHFFVLEIFKSKHDKVFVRHSASISKFEWFE